MKTRSLCRALSAGVVMLCCCAAIRAQAATIVSDFEDGTLQGWTAVNFVAFEQKSPGGNPGGYLYLDNNEIGLAFIFAPAAFLGNLGAYNGGTFAFDGNMLGIGGSFYNSSGDYGSVTITGANADSATLDLLPGGATAPNNAWQTYSAAMTASEWGKSEAAWAAILANVTGISISVEALFGPEIQGIDNIRLVSAASPGADVPLPAALPLFATGLGVIGALGLRRRKRSGAC